MRAPLGGSAGILFLIYFAYVSLGLPDGLLGTAWPEIRADFGVPLNANWPIYVMGMLGGVLSGLSAGRLMAKYPTRTILAWSNLMSCVALVLCAYSTELWMVTCLSFVMGVGNGAVDASLNHHAATHLSSRHMNWLHGFWGVGVSMGTLLYSTIQYGGGNWRTTTLAIAAVVGFAVVLHGSTKKTWDTPAETGVTAEFQPEEAERPRLRESLGVPHAKASLVSFFLYCSVEFGMGVWVTSLLQNGRGWEAGKAALVATCFWGSLTVGRFAAGTISNRVGSRRMLQGGLSGMMAGLLATSLGTLISGGIGNLLLVGGVGISGLSLAPLYPTLMHSTPECVGAAHAKNLIGVQAAAANLGLTVMPGLLGTLLRLTDVRWLGPCLVMLGAFLCLAVKRRNRSIKG